jgi:hypothetical protein
MSHFRSAKFLLSEIEQSLKQYKINNIDSINNIATFYKNNNFAKVAKAECNSLEGHR